MIHRLNGLAQQQHWLSFGLLAAACAGLLVVALWLTRIDLRSRLLPNRIVYPSVLAAVVLLELSAWLAADYAALLRVPLAGLALSAGYLLLRSVSPRGLGWGDVKLGLVLGQFLGFLSWSAVAWSVLFSFLLAGGYAALLLSRGANRKTEFAFGPFMFAGTGLVLLLPS